MMAGTDQHPLWAKQVPANTPAAARSRSSKTAVFLGSVLVGCATTVPTTISEVLLRQTPLNPLSVPKFVEPVPMPSRVDGTELLELSMEEFQQKVLPDSFYDSLDAPFQNGTYLWGYKVRESDEDEDVRICGPSYPGCTIDARRGQRTRVKYTNNLPTTEDGGVVQQLLRTDQTLHSADPLAWGCFVNPEQDRCLQAYRGLIPAVTHLHGGEVAPPFDGHPDAWFTPGLADTGPGFVTNRYRYPNTQEAATLWYHDHSLGTTRLSVFGGLAGFYLLRDEAAEGGLNLPAGPYEKELAIQDRSFDTNGQLFFPSDGVNPDVHPFWVPEFEGNFIVVNGKTWPYLEVEARRYRFRLLNGSNARSYRLAIVSQWEEARQMLPFWQIGTDGGLLNEPVNLQQLLIAPGERADVIVDFKGFAPGTRLLMINDAPIPFMGMFPPLLPEEEATVGQIMQLRVVEASTSDDSFDPSTGDALRETPIPNLAEDEVDTLRQLTLNEVISPETNAPLVLLLNNTKWDGNGPEVPGLGITETPVVGTTERWQIINLTGDMHPIHLHLIQFQLLSRQTFNVDGYLEAYHVVDEAGPPNPYDVPNTDGAVGGNPPVSGFLVDDPMPPAPNERGWKDTVQMNPGEVTTIVARWAPTDVPVGGVQPGQNLFAFDLSLFPGYVWHCHILDHEDNEMMRPYTVRLTP